MLIFIYSNVTKISLEMIGIMESRGSMGQCRAGISYSFQCVCEIFEVCFKPFKVRIVVFNGSCFSNQSSDCTEAFIREVIADKFGKSVLTAAVQSFWKLFDNFSHISE